MRAVGLITEYNPFHNGHRHHLQQSRKAGGADVAVAVMSGHFLQRGEPALVNKWTRTRMALAAGVDLVLELPFAFACNSAPHFARGAVQCLVALGGVDSLCFGSEAGGLSRLQHCADLLRDHAEAVEEETRRWLRKGRSYPEARQRVAEQLGAEDLAEVLSQPNNILGIEYLRAQQDLRLPITPLTVPRVGAGYHDTRAVGDIASATGIRRMLAAGEDISSYVPPSTAELLARASAEGQVVDPIRLETAVLLALQRDPEAIAAGYQVDPGLANRLAEAGRTLADLPALIAQLKSRQLTQTRVQRVLMYQLLGVRATTMTPLLERGPLYLRLLGLSERGQAFLAAHRKARQLPLLTNLSRVYPQLKRFYGRETEEYRLAEEMLAQDLKATRVYGLLLKKRPPGELNRDFYEDPIRWG